jgi:hypothetical protein
VSVCSCDGAFVPLKVAGSKVGSWGGHELDGYALNWEGFVSSTEQEILTSRLVLMQIVSFSNQCLVLHSENEAKSQTLIPRSYPCKIQYAIDFVAAPSRHVYINS